MNRKTLTIALHRRLAEVSITTSALRNQGPPGTIGKARRYLTEKVELKDFFNALKSEDRYQIFLKKHTNALKKELGHRKNGSLWGAARKALNLFFRAVVYDKILFDHFTHIKKTQNYDAMIAPLEIPLDKYSANGIKEICNYLPRWKGIVYLTPRISKRYQEAAQVIARRKKCARVHLDMAFWRQEK